MVNAAYIVVALYGVLITLYVMQKTEHDHIARIDQPLLQWVRRLAFIFVALVLCYSILASDWNRSLPVVMLVAAGDANLTINALALYMRSPSSGHKVKTSYADRRLRTHA